MAASVGFFNPNISNTANIFVVGSILTGACILQKVAQKTFLEKAHKENEISSKHYSMIALAGSSGLSGLLAGADIRKSATLAVASLVLLAVVDYVSLHFNTENKTPGSPEGKRPASPTISAKPPEEGTPVKGKSPKKVGAKKPPEKTSSIPTGGTPLKMTRPMPPSPSKTPGTSGSPVKTVQEGNGHGSPPPVQTVEKAAPVILSSPPRKTWPDPLVKTTPPKVSPSQTPPKPVVKSPEFAQKESSQESPPPPTVEKAAPRKKWPDPLVTTAPPRVAPSQSSPPPVVQSPPALRKEEKSPELAPKGSDQESPKSPPLTQIATSLTIPKQDSPQIAEPGSGQDTSEKEVGPPPPPPFDDSLVDQDLVRRAQQSAQLSAANTTMTGNIPSPEDENTLMVSRLAGFLSSDLDGYGEGSIEGAEEKSWNEEESFAHSYVSDVEPQANSTPNLDHVSTAQLAASLSNLSTLMSEDGITIEDAQEEESLTVAVNEESDVGDAAVVVNSSPPKQSTLEQITDHVVEQGTPEEEQWNEGKSLAVAGHEESHVGDTVVAVVNSSPPKKSPLEHITAEIASTEQTFLINMTSYLGELTLLRDREFISGENYAFIIEGLAEIQETSDLFIEQVKKMGALAAYSNTDIMDRYFSALSIMTQHANDASKMLEQAVEKMEKKEDRDKFKTLWEKPFLPFQRAPRHPLLLKELVQTELAKKVDPSSFEPLRQKFAGLVDKSNNCLQLQAFNSLVTAIRAISQSEETKFEIKDTLGVVIYRVTEREKKVFSKSSEKSDSGTVKDSNKPTGLKSFFKRKSSKSGSDATKDSAEQEPKVSVFQKTTTPPKPGEIIDSVLVLERTLDFLIRMAQFTMDGKPHPGLETLTTKDITDCFTTLVKHEWYKKNEAGKKKTQRKPVPNEIAAKAKILKAVLGIVEKAN